MSKDYNTVQILKNATRIRESDEFSLENDPLVSRKNEQGIRVHKHTLITALVDNPPQNESLCEKWFNRLIKSIDMKIMVPPKAYYCDKDGNRGLTCLAIIETSHISLHAWDECHPGLIELDVFSCKDYDLNDVIILLKEFGLKAINFRCIDRTKGLEEVKLSVVYKTTNLINGKIYIGVHSDYTGNYDYLGSGTVISLAVEKYGRENFSHELIKVFHSEKDAYDFERHIVDYDFIARKDTYNIVPGGKCGIAKLNKTKKYRENLSKQKKGIKTNRKWITNGSENMFLLSPYHEKYVESGKWNYGRTMSDNFSETMSKALTKQK